VKVQTQAIRRAVYRGRLEGLAGPEELAIRVVDNERILGAVRTFGASQLYVVETKEQPVAKRRRQLPATVESRPGVTRITWRSDHASLRLCQVNGFATREWQRVPDDVEALALRLVVGAEPEEDLLLAGNHTPVGHWQMGTTEASNQAGGQRSAVVKLQEVGGAVDTLLQIELGECQVQNQIGSSAYDEWTALVRLVVAIGGVGRKTQLARRTTDSGTAEEALMGARGAGEAMWADALELVIHQETAGSTIQAGTGTMTCVRRVAQGARITRLANAGGSPPILDTGAVVLARMLFAGQPAGVRGASIGAVAMAIAAQRAGAHHRVGYVLALGQRMADPLIVAGVGIGGCAGASVAGPTWWTTATAIRALRVGACHPRLQAAASIILAGALVYVPAEASVTRVAWWTGSAEEATRQIDAHVVAGIHARLTLVHIPRAGTWTGGCRIGIRPRPSLIANAHKAGGIGRLDACAMIATKLPGSAGQAGVVPEATVSAGESIAANAPEMRSRRNTCHLLSLPQGDALFHVMGSK